MIIKAKKWDNNIYDYNYKQRESTCFPISKTERTITFRCNEWDEKEIEIAVYKGKRDNGLVFKLIKQDGQGFKIEHVSTLGNMESLIKHHRGLQKSVFPTLYADSSSGITNNEVFEKMDKSVSHGETVIFHKYFTVTPNINEEPGQASYLNYKDHLDYKMNHEKRGTCVIVSIEQFEGPNRNRKGCAIDDTVIKKAFTKLGFEVELLKNPTGKDIDRHFQQVRQNYYSNDDCFACVITSHGHNEYIESSGGELVHIETLIIDRVRSNKTLLGKPKLFFIQACRGEIEDHGLVADKASTKDEKIIQKTFSAHADVLISFATVQNYKAYRTEENGSVYIKYLAEVLEKECNDMHLVEIMTIVHFLVNSHVKEISKNQLLQVNEFRSTLEKRVFFKK